MDYIINPVMMGGVIKEVHDSKVKINLNGRLGIIVLPVKYFFGKVPESADRVEFYFSYLQTNEKPYDYDYGGLNREEMSPCFIGGIIKEVNDTAVVVSIDEIGGSVSVPRRWVFTSVEIVEGLYAEFYISRVRVLSRPQGNS